MGRRYLQEVAGRLIRPVRKGYRMCCCDCGLVHRIDFGLVPYGSGKKIVFRAWRDERATAAVRAWSRRKGETKETAHA